MRSTLVRQFVERVAAKVDVQRPVARIELPAFIEQPLDVRAHCSGELAMRGRREQRAARPFA